MIKGDKIKLKKKMGVFTNIGEICEVTDVLEDGVICFKFGENNLGCMSYDECEKYFDKVTEPPKHKWSKWQENEDCHYSLGDNKPFSYQYRYDERRIQVKRGGFKAEACCHKDDKFDLEIGLSLATKRLIVKTLNALIEQEIDLMKMGKELEEMRINTRNKLISWAYQNKPIYVHNTTK